MKKTLRKAIIILLTLILFANCTNKIGTENTTNTQQLILFPFVSPDSIKMTGKELIFTYIDSTPFFNPVASKQATLIYTMQREPDSIDYKKLTIKIKMPNRENSVIEYSMTKPEFQQLERNINNPKLKPFYKEFLELNWNSRNNYMEKYMSLLDRTNMIFAHEIDKNYKEQIPNNSTWYGFDSFTVFEQYFGEIEHGKNGIATKLIESINKSDKYLIESDKITLLGLIKKHAEIIKRK